jgi:hypothetical protein
MTYTSAECTVNELLMMDRGTVTKHVEFHAGVNLGNMCVWLVYYKETCYDAARSHEGKKGPKFSYRYISEGSLQTMELKPEKPAQ